MKCLLKMLLLLICFCLKQIQANDRNELSTFLNDFLQYDERPSTVVSYLNLTKKEHVQLCKTFSANSTQFKIAPGPTDTNSDDVVYLADCNSDNTWKLLHKAIKNKTIKSPARWLLFYRDVLQNDENSANKYNHRSDMERQLSDLYIDMGTELFIAFQQRKQVELFSVYKIKPHLPLIWEELGTWSGGFDRPRPPPVAVRRRNLGGAPVVAAAVILDNRTDMANLADYLHRDVDTLTKLVYYMARHLAEWVNGTFVVNRTRSWGYRQPDGRYDGVVREIQDGRADLSGTVMVQTIERSKYMNFVLAPAPVEALFVFKKPALASVTNIYVLPFSIGVWMFLVILILVSSLTLFLAYSRDDVIQRRDVSLLQKMTEATFDTLCLVFQQGTAYDPISIAGRQIMLLGLMAYMFLYTAYSANVVALLQSPANDIDSVETLLASPLACGAQDVLYNRQLFLHETRPIHRAFSSRKILPQGDNAYLSVEDGIRKVREGMYAFHVESTAGFDQIQRTFLEDEKCNLGAIKYMSITYPYLAVAQGSPIKEQLRIGAHRIMESGVQRRTVRRVVGARARCGAGAGVFAAVRLRDVAPALRCLLAAAALAPAALALELLARRRARSGGALITEAKREAAKENTETCEGISEFVV